MDLYISGVDTDKGLSYYGYELDIYLPLLRSYILTIPSSIESLRTVTPETLREYAIAIHGIKGTSASISAEAMIVMLLANIRNWLDEIDKAMSELESAEYEQDADMVAWLIEKFFISAFSEIAEKISNYKKELKL